MSSLIEYGTCEDIDAIEQLYNDLNDALSTGINYPGWIKGVYPIRENARKGIECNNLFVLRYNNQIAGSIILNHEPEKGYDGVEWQFDGGYDDIYIVHTLVVHPAFFKMGIGRKLMDFTERFGVRNGIKSIRLDVYEKNIPAIRLYESCGYHYIETVDLGLGNYGLDSFRLYEKLL